jgi:adenylate cyclase
VKASRFRSFRERHGSLLVASAVVFGVGCVDLLQDRSPVLAVFQRLEWMTYDWRTRVAMGYVPAVAPNLGTVFIDDDSLKTINDRYGFVWPWPRQIYGRLLQELTAEGAQGVAFDILFLERHEPFASEAVEVDPALVTTNVYFKAQLQAAGTNLLSSDDFFALQLSRAGNAVLAVGGEELKPTGELQLQLPIGLFRTNTAALGHIVADVDADGVLRRVRAFYDAPGGKRVWHLGIVNAARELRLDLDRAEVLPGRIVLRGEGEVTRVIPIDRQGFLHINWSLRWNDPHLLQDELCVVLQQADKRAAGRTNVFPRWRDKLVVVGSIGTGNNLTDIGATPLDKQDYRVSVHANVANSVITGRFVQVSGVLVGLLLIVLLGGVSAMVTLNLRAVLASVTMLGVLAFYVAAAMLLFVQHRYWLPLVLPVVAGLLTHVALVTHQVVVERKERHRVRSVFTKVVSPDVVNELLKAEQVSLGGARRRVSIFFADVRGFTRVTDETQAAAEEHIRQHGLTGAAAEAYLDGQAGEILSTVNLYLGVIADTVKRHNGTLDKYIGDCVMAFWGAPTANERHAVDCVQAAIDAQRAIYALNLQRASDNQRRIQENGRRAATGLAPLPLNNLMALGSGINTGPVTVGLMGSEAHILNYTVFGREVNLASRLEGASGRGRIVISATTFAELQRLEPALAAQCSALDPIQIRGFREPVRAFEVLWRTAREIDDHFDTNIVLASKPTPTTGFQTAEPS